MAWGEWLAGAIHEPGAGADQGNPAIGLPSDSVLGGSL
jgi:hypothetical protein